MIVKMKEVFLLIFRKDVDLALKMLRKLGLIHVKHLVKSLPDTMEDLEEELTMLSKALEIVSDFNAPDVFASKDKVYSLAEKAIHTSAKRNTLITDIQELKERVHWYKKWGNFSL